MMDLFADVLARLQRHQHQLQVPAGVQDATEMRIVLGQVFDIANKALHAIHP